MWFRTVGYSGLILISWVIMTFTHEIGHILVGQCGGGKLIAYELLPWRIPYSLFSPDPNPLITLWGGLISGVLLPWILAIVVRQNWLQIISGFCILANGLYISTGWFIDAPHLDTQRLLKFGANPIPIILYCLVCLLIGYRMFRNSSIRFFQDEKNVADSV